MSTIKFTVEDSKVSEVLKALLNSNVIVGDIEVTNTKPNNKARVIPYEHIKTSPYAASQPYVYDTWEDSTTWSVRQNTRVKRGDDRYAYYQI